MTDARTPENHASQPVHRRPTWEEYFLDIARAVSARAECTRRQVGAIIVKDRRIMAEGYNGGAPGAPSCLEGACPRGRLSTTELPGFDAAVGANSSYDTGAGACIAIHAEQNAVMYCSMEQRQGATLYCTDEPCPGCMKMLGGSGIDYIVWPTGTAERLPSGFLRSLPTRDMTPLYETSGVWSVHRRGA